MAKPLTSTSAVALNEIIGEYYIDKIAPTMDVAVEVIMEIFRRFPEVTVVFDELTLEQEVARSLAMPFATIFYIGGEVQRQEAIQSKIGH
jgi:hypothetical protein